MQQRSQKAFFVWHELSEREAVPIHGGEDRANETYDTKERDTEVEVISFQEEGRAKDDDKEERHKT